MKRRVAQHALASLGLASLGLATAMLVLAQPAHAQRSAYAHLVKAHAEANDVPEQLVHRVIMRESKYQAHLVGRGNTIGLMQIKLPTARGVGYRGDASGLRDPETNLTYGVRYLAGAWRVARGNQDRAVSLYARGYYYDAKRMGIVPMRTTLVPAAAVDIEPAATSADAPQQHEQAIAALPAKRVPIPRSRPNSPRPDVANAELVQPDAAETHAAAPPASAPVRREAPNSIEKFWDDLTNWARR